MSNPESAGAAALTEREREVVRALITHGHQREAAHALGITVSTLKNHLATVTRKLGRESSLQVAIAVDRDDRRPTLDEHRLQYALDVLDLVTREQRSPAAQAARAWVVARAYDSSTLEPYAPRVPLARLDGDGDGQGLRLSADQESFDGSGVAR